MSGNGRLARSRPMRMPRSLSAVLVRFVVFVALVAGTTVVLATPARAAAVDPAATTFVTMHAPAGPWWSAGTSRTWRSDVDQATTSAGSGLAAGKSVTIKLKVT